jgi:YVTN family beta-propeller protein
MCDVRYRRSWSARVPMAERFAAAATLLVVASSACSLPSGGGGGALETSVSPVIATIPLSNYGADVAVRPDGTRAYVPLQTGSVLAVDLTSRQVASTITTNGRPCSIAVARDGRHAYVADLTGESLFVLDTTNDSLATSVALGAISRPTRTPAIAVSPDGRRVYLTSATATDDHLLVIDTETNTVAGDYGLDIHPVGIAVSPDGARLYVAGCESFCTNGTLLILDAANTQVVSRIALPAAPVALALSPDGSRAYTPTGLSGTVQAIQLADGTTRTIPVDALALGITVHPSGAFVYVTCYGGASVSVIGARINTVLSTIRVANEPRAIATSPDGHFAYVTHSSPILSVIDLHRVTGGVPSP